MRVGAFEIAEPVPELRSPRAIAILKPWVDVGKVGTLALARLEGQLGAVELGRPARPGTFFDFTRNRPEMRIVEGRRVIITPNCVINYARSEHTGEDFMFLHLLEPNAIAEDYTDAILGLIKHFGVSDYCRIGGMYDAVPHTRPLLVTGVLDETHSEAAGSLVSSRGSSYQGPTSIVSVLSQLLEDLDVKTSMLMAHLPHYAQVEEDHLGAARLMEVLCAMYGFPTDLVDPGRGREQYEAIGRLVAGDADAKKQISRLEAEYDQAQETSGPVPPIEISPDVEKFLREMSQRLDKPNGEEG